MSRGGHRSGSSRTLWSSLPMWCPWFRFWTSLWCRREKGGGGALDGDQVVAVLKASDFPVPEKVIKVPKKSKSSRRCFVPEFCFSPVEHQTTEQLVEVPTVVSFSSLQRTAEESIDIPGTGRWRRSSRFAPRTQFYSVGGEQIVDLRWDRVQELHPQVLALWR